MRYLLDVILVIILIANIKEGTMNPRYRLLHKKDGTYVLQKEMTGAYVDEKGETHYTQYLEDIPTEEEQ